MSDIKLTLSQDTSLRSEKVEDEAAWMSEEGPIYYQLHRRPKTALPGCRVYFVRAGRLVGRAIAEDFVEQTGEEELYSFTGAQQTHEGWSVHCSEMEVLDEPFRIETQSGFQGFRNVQGEEQKQFEQAFQKQAQGRKQPEPEDDSITLSSGHAVVLMRLVLNQTYGGLLEGTLETASRYIRRNLQERTRQAFPYVEGVAIVDDGGGTLPHLQWMALFECGKPVRTDHPDYASRLVVCWFTNRLPADMKTMLEHVLAHLEWDALAEDYDIIP